jgi:hypothetical protein
MQLPGTEGVKKAVEAGLGVGMVSRFAIEAECLAGVLRVIPVEGWRLTRPMCLVYRSQKYFSPVRQRFREFATSYGAEHLELLAGGPEKRNARPSRAEARGSGHAVGARDVPSAAGRNDKSPRR